MIRNPEKPAFAGFLFAPTSLAVALCLFYVIFTKKTQAFEFIRLFHFKLTTSYRHILMMKEHLKILELAIQNNLPMRIDRSTPLSVIAARELINAGHLTGIDATSFEGDAIVDPKITLSGRQFLANQKKDYGFRGLTRRHMPCILRWFFGIITAVLTAWLIQLII